MKEVIYFFCNESFLSFALISSPVVHNLSSVISINLLSGLQLVSELTTLGFLPFMADGTRLRGLDEGLGVQDGKVTKFMGEMTKNREEIKGKMEGMESRIGGMDALLKEIKMLLGLQISPTQGANSEPLKSGFEMKFGSTFDTGGAFHQSSQTRTPTSQGRPNNTGTLDSSLPFNTTIPHMLHTMQPPFSVAHTGSN